MVPSGGRRVGLKLGLRLGLGLRTTRGTIGWQAGGVKVRVEVRVRVKDHPWYHRVAGGWGLGLGRVRASPGREGGGIHTYISGARPAMHTYIHMRTLHHGVVIHNEDAQLHLLHIWMQVVYIALVCWAHDATG